MILGQSSRVVGNPLHKNKLLVLTGVEGPDHLVLRGSYFCDMMTDADAVFYLFLSEFPWVPCWLITKLAIWWPTIKMNKIKCLAQEQGTLLGSSDGCM